MMAVAVAWLWLVGPAHAVAGALPPGDYVAVGGAMIFDRPAVGAKGVASLAVGAAVTVLPSPTVGSWVKIRDAAGRIGYVTAGSLSDRWGEPPPPVAAQPHAAIEATPVAEPAANPKGTTPAALSDAQAAAMEQRALEAADRAQRAAERAGAGGDAGAWGHAFPNGDRYDGEWRTDTAQTQPRRAGLGAYRFANGARYDGEWVDDLMTGLGVMRYPDGGRFAGQFHNGQPEGWGVHRTADGGLTAGRWRAGVRVMD